MIKALSQLYCPQSAIHGWAGLAMDLAMYQFLKGTAFFLPINPGLTAIYPQWVAPTTVKMINATFLRKKNYFLLYKNIARACLRMFDANIGAQFKVSNSPALMGWNSTMSIINILNQLQVLYGKPTMMMLFQNDVMIRNPMAPTGSPEMLFYRIEQCQKSNTLGSYLTLMNRSMPTWCTSSSKPTYSP